MGKFLGTYMQTCIIKILGNNFQQQLQHPITKKADAEPKKSRSNKKSRCRTSLLKNGPTKLPCLLIILASWVDFFDIGLLLYPVPHHTLQCCTRKSFWVTRTGESKLFCIGFSLFWSRCRTWCTWKSICIDYPKFYRLFLTKSAFLWGKLWKNWNCAVIFCRGRVLKGEITSPIYWSPTQAVQGDNPIVKK